MFHHVHGSANPARHDFKAQLSRGKSSLLASPIISGSNLYNIGSNEIEVLQTSDDSNEFSTGPPSWLWCSCPRTLPEVSFRRLAMKAWEVRLQDQGQ